MSENRAFSLNPLFQSNIFESRSKDVSADQQFSSINTEEFCLDNHLSIIEEESQQEEEFVHTNKKKKRFSSSLTMFSIGMKLRRFGSSSTSRDVTDDSLLADNKERRPSLFLSFFKH